jgi:hypothetical protein
MAPAQRHRHASGAEDDREQDQAELETRQSKEHGADASRWRRCRAVLVGTSGNAAGPAGVIAAWIGIGFVNLAYRRSWR